MGLYKKEVLVRPTSTISVQGAKDWTQNWLTDTFQDADDNKDENGNYIDYFFADIFDSRTSNIYRVYTDACKSKYDLSEINFDILIIGDLAKKVDVETLVDTVENVDTRVEALENKDGVEAVVI